MNHRGRLCHAGMEPLWSSMVATGGTQWQIRSARNPPKQAKSVAVGCERLPEKFHGNGERCACYRALATDLHPEKEGVVLPAPQNAKSCEPEGPQDLTR